jgi:pimeloyl-ACP methyl ester carboxylesterase
MRLVEERYGEGAATPLVIAHGLFGAGRNWASLAKRLARARPVIAVDMRNHGDSGWSDEAGYRAMAGDLAETVAAAGGVADVLGHSMGGKAAMALTLSAPQRVRRLIVADIAQVTYDHAHGDYVAAMRAVDMSRVTRRSDADPMLAPAIPQAPLRAFILQNLAVEDGRSRWRPNLDALAATMDDILSFPADLPHARWDGPALFLRGGVSDYVADAHLPAVRARFPAARIETIAGAGHWLHADRPEPFVRAVEAFLDA